MADYVRGEAVPHAVAYELRERDSFTKPNGGESSIFIHLDTKYVGKKTYTNKGLIDVDGAIVPNQSWTHTDMFNINDLANVPGTSSFISDFIPGSDLYSLAVYSKKDDYSSFVAGYAYADFDGNTDIEAIKKIIGYDYVVFAQQRSEIWVNHKGNLEFCLDDYADKLGVRATNTLTVRALGDGVNYSNSEYSKSVFYNNPFYKG